MSTPNQNPSPGCDPNACSCHQLDRRDFLSAASLTALATLGAPPLDAVAGPFEDKDFERLIPADKMLRPEWLASLTARGEPESYSGQDLRFIGMPVGGICTGTLYLAGDGRLWLWNIFNQEAFGIRPQPASYEGRQLSASDGSAYVSPPEPIRPLEQGFALRIGARVVPLDATGFRQVTFTGQYPMGTITYRDADVPVSAKLEAYSPFVPLDADDSGLPATVLTFTLTNTSPQPVELTLAGWLENAVCLHHRQHAGVRKNHIRSEDGFTLLECSAARPPRPVEQPRPDIAFESWSREDYEGWKVEGEAFGSGPILKKKMPAYQGDVGGPGERVVNSHATAPGNDIAAKDSKVGRLTSKPFLIERRFIHLWVGGGGHAGQTCVNLKVDGKVVRSVTGRNDNRMQPEAMEVGAFQGKQAILEIVDEARGGWGNIGVGRITFSDRPVDMGDLETLHDFGALGLVLLGPPAEHRLARASGRGFEGKEGERAETPLEEHLVGALGRKLHLEPGKSATVSFAVVWHFPNLTLAGRLRGRHYASRFADTAAVARYVVSHFDRLSSLTRRWRDTWYDSTLPHWLLNRTFANTSILATTTCYRLKDGRFWAWEGIGCCPGTCIHVWHYAQAMARIFPQLERDLRERVDFGLALDSKTGVIHFRGEYGDTFAVDGQCGTILRAYREHQMSADPEFLNRLWPRIRKALECVIARDPEGAGILYGPLHNTLDADWFGVVPWLVGMYHAGLRGGEEMAREVGDEAFARKCREILERGIRKLDRMTWKEEYGYYVQLPDSKHAAEVGVYDGCHIDQVLAQSWAWQVDLGRVMDAAHTKQALRSLWRYSVTPDVGPFRRVNRAGRWYAMPGDGGLIMVTFPHGRPKALTGAGAWSAMYFNECMSGFEWQVVGHMIWEGMLTEGLAVARMIHDRYSARLRNPYNEVECSDHYARAMASYGAFLAVCGFRYHGPKKFMAFAPRLTPDDFRAAFTAAEGWGTYSQTRKDGRLTARLQPAHGLVRLKSFGLELPEGKRAGQATVTAGGKRILATVAQSGAGVTVSFGLEARVEAGKMLEVVVEYSA